MFDYLIVGCGLSGMVLAERLANDMQKRVLIVDKRNHIGGNCYDYFDESGVLVHKYGPHYFRTNMGQVFRYLSCFTSWHYVQYKIKVMVDGRLVSLPINLDTVNDIFGYSYNSDEFYEYLNNCKCNIDVVKNSEDAIISQVGYELYNKIYKPYTLKQWGIEPSQLDASVCSRIPVRTNRDDRYFSDKYQAMPKHGYHNMFKNMLRSSKIKLMLQTDFEEIREIIPYMNLIFTGPIDAYFKYSHGNLPYRSLRFEHETIHKEFYQVASQINYPHDYDFTRIVEIKHATGQIHPYTTIVREYPCADGEPFYPIPHESNEQMYQKYRLEADKLQNTHFIGRLAQYRYLNMDQVVANALELYDKIRSARA